MKVVGIVGSARKGGNTELLTNLALEEIRKEGIEIELISLAGKRINPCNGCGGCSKTDKCRFKDDFEEVYAKVLDADGLILASPVYYGAASPQISAFISRFYPKHGKPLSRKVGGPIVVARRAGQNFTFAQLMYFFMIHEMIVPGSTYWNVTFGRAKGDALKDEEGVNTVRRFGQNMAWLLKKIKSSDDAES